MYKVRVDYFRGDSLSMIRKVMNNTAKRLSIWFVEMLDTYDNNLTREAARNMDLCKLKDYREALGKVLTNIDSEEVMAIPENDALFLLNAVFMARDLLSLSKAVHDRSHGRCKEISGRGLCHIL